MSLLMKALKQAEKRHQQATAVALEQSAGESVADALATSAPDALDAAADRAAGAADAAAVARDNARSAADQTEPGANDYAHLSLSIAEMAATTLTLEDAEQTQARANPVPAAQPLPALLSGDPIARRRTEPAAAAVPMASAPASHDPPAAPAPPVSEPPRRAASPADSGVAVTRKRAAPDRSRLYLWGATGSAMLGIGSWLAWQLFAPVGSAPGPARPLPPMAMVAPQTGDADAAVAAARDGVAPAASVPADEPAIPAAPAPKAAASVASVAPAAPAPQATTAPARAASRQAATVPDTSTPAASMPSAPPAPVQPRARVAAPAVAAPAVELAGTALLGEPPRLVPGRGPATAAPARSDDPSRAGGVRLVRADNGEQVSRLLEAGYAALGASDHPAAQSAYEKVIALDANNGDAFVGLATLHARAGRTAQAERAYNRALEIDPNDGSARAGLVALRGGGDLAAQESQFRHMLAQDDSQPAVHHALGNVLASQGRWAEAQQAYFNASAGDPDQPDYAYNLAISLERLKQPRAAAGHYRRAIELAARRPARFPLDTARARLAALDAGSRPPADKAD